MNLVIAVYSFIILLILMIFYFFQDKIKNEETNIYSALLLCSFFNIIFNIIGISIGFGSQNMKILRIINHLDLPLYFWGASFLLTYLVNVYFNLSKKDINIYKKIKRSLFLLNIIFTFITLFLPIDIILNPDAGYAIGLCVNFIYLISVFYLLFCILFAILLLKSNEIKKAVPVFFFLFFCFLIIIMQRINPSLILVPSMIILVEFAMFNTIENPNVKMIKQLELARDQADKANRAKTDFLSSMSHEIRTPLNAITGFSDCVLNSNTLDEAKENAKDIITASNTLLEIVNGILDISKIEAGKLEIVNSPYDALELFSNLGKLIKPRMAEKGLDFQIYIAPDLPKILYGDHANIKKVVTNLLSNACKYTDRGYVRYDVNCVNNENSTRLIISVEDSGRGIKKDNIDKLFTKFQRLEEDRNTTIEGTGLGLAITKQLVELMGGKVVVHSIYGQGSKFTIILDQKIEKEVNIVKNVDNNRNNNFDLSGYRILIVDDNQLNLKVASKLLMRYNATIVCCESGFDCINLLKNDTSFDIILMDDMMPKMSGSETLHKIKQMPGINIPIIALTANAISGMREKYISDGFDDYLAKPIEKLELIRVFNDLVLCKDPISKSSNISSQKNDDIEQLEDTVEIPKIGNFNKEQFLRENGIDLDKALEFLGDMEMYDMTVKDYLSEIDNKITDLTRFKLEKDISNYAILVHSMKSDAKYLGLMEFASMAYKHELESKAGNISYVEENFEDLMKNLRKWLIVIKKYSQNI